MLKTVVIVIVVLIAGVLVFAATRPDRFRIQRATSIKAPPEKIFPRGSGKASCPSPTAPSPKPRNSLPGFISLRPGT
jgi:hypothetical protein